MLMFSIPHGALPWPAMWLLVLGFVSSIANLYFESKSDSKSGKIKRAFCNFIITGVGSTLVSFVILANSQKEAAFAKTQAAEEAREVHQVTERIRAIQMRTDHGVFQISKVIGKSVSDILNCISNNASLVSNNPFSTVISITLDERRNILLYLDQMDDSKPQEADNDLRTQISELLAKFPTGSRTTGSESTGNSNQNPGSTLASPQAPAAISVSPLSADFGVVPLNTTATNYVTVQNVGGGTLVGNVSVSAPFKVVSGGTYSLSRGQSQAIVISYTPTGGASNAGILEFTGNAGATATVKGIPGL